MPKVLNYPDGTPAQLSDVLYIARPGAPALPKRLTVADLVSRTQRQNMLLNGGFDVAQRGPGFTLTTSYAFTLDRWMARQQTLAQSIVQRVDFHQTNLGARSALQIFLSGNSNGVIQIAQAMETVDSVELQGRTATLRFQAFTGSNWTAPNITATVYWGTNVDGPTSGIGGAGWTAISQNFVPTPAAQTFAMQAAIPVGAYQVGVQFQCQPSGAAVDANSFLYLTNGTLTDSSVTPGSHVRRPIALETLLCQRHLPAIAGVVGQAISVGVCSSTSAANIVVPFPVPTRIAPTGLVVSGAGHFNVVQAAGSQVAATAAAFAGGCNASGVIALTGASGLAAGNGTVAVFNNANGRLYFTGAEL